jgi:hypothetical protein
VSLVEMVTGSEHIATSSLVRPELSVPNTSAISWLPPASTVASSVAAARTSRTGSAISRRRAVSAACATVPASAASRLSHSTAASSTSVAPELMATASSCGKCLGFTR